MYIVYAENIRQGIRAHELNSYRDQGAADRAVRRYRREYGKGWSIWWKKQ